MKFTQVQILGSTYSKSALLKAFEQTYKPDPKQWAVLLNAVNGVTGWSTSISSRKTAASVIIMPKLHELYEQLSAKKDKNFLDDFILTIVDGIRKSTNFFANADAKYGTHYDRGARSFSFSFSLELILFCDTHLKQEIKDSESYLDLTSGLFRLLTTYITSSQLSRVCPFNQLLLNIATFLLSEGIPMSLSVDVSGVTAVMPSFEVIFENCMTKIHDSMRLSSLEIEVAELKQTVAQLTELLKASSEHDESPPRGSALKLF